jgi:hypothetical protein
MLLTRAAAALHARQHTHNREAKYLQRMDLHVPEGARSLLLQEEKFKFYFSELSFAVSAAAAAAAAGCCSDTAAAWAVLTFGCTASLDPRYTRRASLAGARV